MEIKELNTAQEMLEQLQLIHYLYPNLPKEKYQEHLENMLAHNYTQIAVFSNDICVGLTGCWLGTKLWSGKYVEIDNFIVHPDYRKLGIGKLLTDYVQQKATDNHCTMIVLDAFTSNYKAHRFYYNQGFEPRGFHFIKILNEEGLS